MAFVSINIDWCSWLGWMSCHRHYFLTTTTTTVAAVAQTGPNNVRTCCAYDIIFQTWKEETKNLPARCLCIQCVFPMLVVLFFKCRFFFLEKPLNTMPRISNKFIWFFKYDDGTTAKCVCVWFFFLLRKYKLANYLIRLCVDVPSFPNWKQKPNERWKTDIFFFTRIWNIYLSSIATLRFSGNSCECKNSTKVLHIENVLLIFVLLYIVEYAYWFSLSPRT